MKNHILTRVLLLLLFGLPLLAGGFDRTEEREIRLRSLRL